MEKIPPFPRLQEPNEAAVDAWWRSRFAEEMAHIKASLENAGREIEEAKRAVIDKLGSK